MRTDLAYLLGFLVSAFVFDLLHLCLIKVFFQLNK